MKGIVLAGGTGSRLHPMTLGVSKQLLPLYDKPMVYYPISVLMLAGIKEILIITTPQDQDSYKRVLGDGSNFGINIKYEVQKYPGGLAESFIIGEEFIGKDSVCLILGDNFFYGQSFTKILEETVHEMAIKKGGIIFGYPVKDPERFGVVEFNKNKKVISIEEKPEYPKSSYAITGLYFYDNAVIEIAKGIDPSPRGEKEITSINNEYLQKNKLKVKLLGRGFAWLDTGTAESLFEATTYVRSIQNTQGFKIACLEEIALNKGWINKDIIMKNIINNESSYNEYLKALINDL